MGILSHRPPDGGTGTDRGEDRFLQKLLFWGALSVGALRFWQLGAWSLWLDEALTLTDSRSEGHDNPLGYFLLGRFYELWQGRPDEFLLRLPAAVFGWASIPLSVWVFRPLAGRLGATVVAWVLATSSWHLYWSQNARFYTLALCLALLGGGVYLRGVLSGGKGPLVLGLALAAAAGLAHPSAAILTAAFLFAPWLVRWLTGRKENVPWGTLATLTLGLFVAGAPWAWGVWAKWSFKTGGGSLAHFLLATGYMMTPTLGVLALLGLWCAVRRDRFEELLLGAIQLLAFVIATGASLFVRMSAQYVFVCLPWTAVVAALCIRSLVGRERPRPLLLAGYLLVLSLPGLVDSSLYFALRGGDRPDWRGAFLYVHEQLEPGDLIFGMEAPVGEYYLDPLASDLRDWRRVVWLDRFRAELPDEWARYGRRSWFVLNLEQLNDWPLEDRRAMLRTLEEDCRVMRHFEIPWTPRDLDVWVYLRDGAMADAN